MTLNIRSRDKKFLIGGGIFVAGYLFFFLVAQPVYKKQITINGNVVARQEETTHFNFRLRYLILDFYIFLYSFHKKR